MGFVSPHRANVLGRVKTKKVASSSLPEYEHVTYVQVMCTRMEAKFRKCMFVLKMILQL
jgi:hypothetical protein